MRRSATIGLWLVATALTTGIAFWAVNTAGSEVNDRPLTAVVASPVATAEATTTGASTTTTVVATTSVASAPTTPPASSSSTAPWQQYTLNSAGGSIIVSYRPNEVRLESVAPAAGFDFEIDDEGPDRVEVEFDGDDVSYSLRAEWDSSGFTTRVDTSGGGG